MNVLSKRFRGFLPIVVDIETAGFDPERNALLEISVIFMNYQDGRLKEVETFHEHVIPEPGLVLDEDALEFTKIIPDHPFRYAISEAEMLKKLSAAIETYCEKYNCSRAVLVGHNGQFDLSFIQAALTRHQVPMSLHRFLVFDTATLSAAFLGETVLARAVRKAGMSFDEAQAHGALYDATVTAKLFSYLIHLADEGRKK
ncbi:MAG: exonuclease domain-containing protein [Pseudomonadota bacterium]|nr:exonuclease domain-containing protein [Pseudomonadota bacterium]